MCYSASLRTTYGRRVDIFRDPAIHRAHGDIASADVGPPVEAEPMQIDLVEDDLGIDRFRCARPPVRNG
jgi:hypothetical protein